MSLPSTWDRVKLSDALEALESGVRPKGGVRHIMEGIPSLGGEHLKWNGTFNLKNVKYIPLEFAQTVKRGKIQAEDILLVKDGATTGKVAFVDKDFPFENAFVNEHVFRCAIFENYGYPKFFYWYLFSADGRSEILKNFRGVAQGGIIKSFADNVEVPLPPIEEQKYIVDKLDFILNKVFRIKERLDIIPEAISQLRQSLYNQAASGELTKNWRIKMNIEDGRIASLKEIVLDRPRNGYSPKAVEYPTATKSLTLSATTRGIFDEQHFKYLDVEIPSDSHLWIEPGDILIQRANTIEYVGVSAVFNGATRTFVYPDLMMKVRPTSEILSEYLHYALMSQPVRQYFRNNATGVSGTMPKINQKVVSEAQIKVPDILEQQQIVRRVNSVLDWLRQIEERYQLANAELDSLVHVILSRAFNGNLSRGLRESRKNFAPIDKSDNIKRNKTDNIKIIQGEMIMLTKEIKSLVEIITTASKPLATSELLLEAGYPNDASTEEIEKFFIELRTLLRDGLISRERIGEEDFFTAKRDDV